MSKLANKAKSSKLKSSIKKQFEDSIVRKIDSKEYPRSYRLDAEVMNTLKTTLDRINESSPKKISESRLVKALIFLSKDMKEKAIMKALKEVW